MLKKFILALLINLLITVIINVYANRIGLPEIIEPFSKLKSSIDYPIDLNNKKDLFQGIKFTYPISNSNIPEIHTFAELLHSDNKSCQYCVQVGVQAPKQEYADLVFTFILDISGSMAFDSSNSMTGLKIDKLKDACKSIIARIKEIHTNKKEFKSATINIISFANDAKYKSYDLYDEELITDIDSLEAAGGTNLEEAAIKFHENVILSNNYTPNFNHIILITDGNPDEPKSINDSILINGLFPKITTIGIQMPVNCKIKDWMIDKNLGSFVNTNDITLIPDIVIKEINKFINLSAKDIKIKLSFPFGVNISSAYITAEDVKFDNHNNINELEINEKRLFKGYQLSMTMDIVSDRAIENIPIDFTYYDSANKRKYTALDCNINTYCFNRLYKKRKDKNVNIFVPSYVYKPLLEYQSLVVTYEAYNNIKDRWSDKKHSNFIFNNLLSYYDEALTICLESPIISELQDITVKYKDSIN